MTPVFEPRDPAFRDEVARIFAAAPFVRELGFRLTAVEPGAVESEVVIEPRHLQHHGYVHAGVQATLADHTAGAAATTLIPAGRAVLTIEVKTSLLAPARGVRLVCRSEVLKPGRTVSFVESRVFAVDADERATLTAHATVSLAVVDDPGRRDRT